MSVYTLESVNHYCIKLFFASYHWLCIFTARFKFLTRRLVDITSSIASLHLPVLASQSSINTRRGSDRNFSRQPKLIFFNLVRLSRMLLFSLCTYSGSAFIV